MLKRKRWAHRGWDYSNFGEATSSKGTNLKIKDPSRRKRVDIEVVDIGVGLFWEEQTCGNIQNIAVKCAVNCTDCTLHICSGPGMVFVFLFVFVFVFVSATKCVEVLCSCSSVLEPCGRPDSGAVTGACTPTIKLSNPLFIRKIIESAFLSFSVATQHPTPGKSLFCLYICTYFGWLVTEMTKCTDKVDDDEGGDAIG